MGEAYEKIKAWWQGKHIKSAAELAAVLNGYVIAFAYHSGKIENEQITFHDTREIFDKDGVVNYTGDLRTLFEIRNAKDASNMILAAFERRTQIDEAFVKRLQYELTKNTYDGHRYQGGERPGEFKKHDYVTGREEVGALPEDVPEELGEVLAEIQAIPQDKALTAAAYLHAKFENIHPFADGNGRTGRLLMNYLLLLLDHPPIVIHEEDRNSYYAALERWDTAQELMPLREFLRTQIVKTWQKQLDKESGQTARTKRPDLQKILDESRQIKQ